MGKVFNSITAGHRIIILIVILLTIPALYASMNIKVDSSTELFLVYNDNSKKIYDGFTAEFGSDETMLVMITAPLEKILNSNQLKKIKTGLEKIPWITQVYDPVQKYRVAGSGSGPINISTLKEKVNNNPFDKRGALISFNKGYIVYVIKLAKEIKGRRGNIFNQTMAVLSNSGINMKSVKVAGLPVVNHFLSKTPREVNTIFFPLLFAISAVVLYSLFRDIRIAASALILIAVVEIFVFGFIGLTGKTINVITTIVPVVIYIITLAASIHFLAHLAENWDRKADVSNNILNSMKEKFTPCLFASFTTSAGFGSLILSPLTPIREMGMYLMYGSIVSFLMLYTLLPSLLIIFIKRQAAAIKWSCRSSEQAKKTCSKNKFLHSNSINIRPVTSALSLTGIFEKLVDFAQRRCVVILILSSLPVVYVFWKLPEITFQTNSLYYFKQESFIRTNTAHLEDNGLALSSIEVILNGKENDFKDEDILKKLDDLTSVLERINGVLKVYSQASLLSEANGLKFSTYELPSFLEIDALYAGIEKENKDILYSFTNRSFSKARVSIGIKTTGYQEYKVIKSKVENAFAQSGLLNSLTTTFTGQFPLLMSVQGYLMETLTKSFLVSFVVIIICFFIVTKNFYIGLLSIVPNLFPVFCALGFIFLFGLDFDIANVMIASIILGIAVDDTGHFILCMLKSKSWNNSLRKSILYSYQKTGSAILFTTLILSTGFLVVTFSDFIPIRNFGILSSLSVITALMGDLLVLPALLFACNFFKNQGKGDHVLV